MRTGSPAAWKWPRQLVILPVSKGTHRPSCEVLTVLSHFHDEAAGTNFLQDGPFGSHAAIDTMLRARVITWLGHLISRSRPNVAGGPYQ
jgi:hypothetical protein